MMCVWNSLVKQVMHQLLLGKVSFQKEEYIDKIILTSYARKGVNALDAMVQLWNNISMMRQQLMPTDRVHGIVTDGGKAVSLWIKFGV